MVYRVQYVFNFTNIVMTSNANMTHKCNDLSSRKDKRKDDQTRNNQRYFVASLTFKNLCKPSSV